MQAERFEILSRYKAIEGMYPARDDFTLGPGAAADARIALDEPGWSLYCIDAALAEAVFVHLPGNGDLAEAAFVGVTQFREADRLLTIPISGLSELAAGLPMPHVIWVFSMGRSGSTLISHVLNGSTGVWGLSEPSVFDPRGLRAAGTAAIPAMVKLFYARAPAGRDTLAIKLRSQSIFQAGEFYAATPDARYVYLYRNAVGWAGSIYNMLQSFGMSDRLEGEALDFHWAMIMADMPIAILGEHVDISRPVALEQITPLNWAMYADDYLKHLDAGLPFIALSYDAFAAEPAATTARLFAHCGLPAADLPQALTAFDRDSQEGTALARDASRLSMTAEQTATFIEKLAGLGYPDPGYVLPDMYSRGN